MSSKRGLGKGLDALLMGVREPSSAKSSTALSASSNPQSSVSQPVASSDVSLSQGFLEVPITHVKPGRYQPRRDIDTQDLQSLADSIRIQGIIQPIIVKRLQTPGQYEIIAGERRWRAAQLVELKTVPIVVKEVKEETAMAMALIENIQRQDLNAVDEAMALDRLIKEFNLTHNQVAEAVGKSRVSVTNALRLLTLADDVKLLLEQGKIEVGHAKVLLALRGHLQSKIAHVVVQKGLSVRETERLVAAADESNNNSSAQKRTLDPDIRRLQQQLSETLGARLEIAHGQQGKGKVVIHYNSLEELDGILEHIK